jgi:hypothetical protein
MYVISAVRIDIKNFVWIISVSDMTQWGLGTLQSGIKVFVSTLDPYGPRNNANFGNFIVTDFDL